MTVYGDLDVSVLDELPPGRGSLRTHLRSMEHEHQAAQFVREQAGKGRQAFVLCPLVEESDKIQMSDVLSTRRRWEALLGPGLSCGLLHGRLNGEEKERVMRAFRAGEIQVLVATTVIEVGVDVPNATLMIVLHAERFGLAQLHQLRGRVGRGPHPSHCILLCDSQNPEAIERLRVLEETRDGFRIAEEDLRQRGPGDLLGVAQSGLPGLRLADPVADAGLLCEARELADALLETDPALEQARHAPLRELLLQGERNLAGTG
jgi:ATP-dependent DNA helicase RecG